MTLDDILLEWSYRLPKGYPTVVDGQFTSEAELNILKEVLRENNVADVPSIFQRIANQPITLTEAEEGYNKEDLINLIKSAQLSEKDLVRITRIVDAVGSESGIVELLQSQKNFDPQTAKQVFSMATEAGSYKALLKMLEDPSIQIPLSDLGLEGNLVEVVSSTGVTTEFAKEMGNMVPYTSVKMGRYEMFLRLFLRGGQSPTKKGDVEVSGEEMEVKSTISKGSGFRLRGQSGYGNGKQVQQSFLKQLTDLYGVGGPSHGGSQNIPQPILDAYKTQNGQMWYGTSDSWAVLANRDLIEAGFVNKEEVILMWSTALAELYPDSSPEAIADFIGPAFEDDGSINVKEAASRLAAYEFSIYREKEGFAYFIAVNFRDDYGFIPADVEGDALINLFKTLFKVVSLPNTKNNATPQDSLTAIELA